MKTFFEAAAVALAMYSKIPMPHVTWNEKNMRYSFLMFPFVGVAVAGVVYAFLVLFHTFTLSSSLVAALAVASSVMITGGLHLDGFCDTVDALSSQKDREEKLRILKDPHTGAFAVIYTVAALLLQFGAWVEISGLRPYWLLVLISYIMSRAFSALAVVTLPCARDSGLAHIFAGYASKHIVRNGLIFYILISFSAMVYYQPVMGVILLGFVTVSYLWFSAMVKKQFGGITGDLAGFWLVLCETGIVTLVAVMGGIVQ